MTIQLRRGTAAEWDSANPVLASGEPSFEKDTGNFKIGDGSTAYNSLPPFASGGDASTDTATSVDGELVAFKGTGGKLLQRVAGTGAILLTDGVYDVVDPAEMNTFLGIDAAQLKIDMSLDLVDNTSDETKWAATKTLTNTRIIPRVPVIVSGSTPAINTDLSDMFGITALAVDITSMTSGLSGSPYDGEPLWIYIVGTATRQIAWGTGFEDGAASLPTATSGTQRLDAGFVYNDASSKWRCMVVSSA